MNPPEPNQPLNPISESKANPCPPSYWPILGVLVSPVVLGLVLVFGQRGEPSGIGWVVLMFFASGPVCAHLTLKRFKVTGWKKVASFLLLTPLYAMVSLAMIACGCAAIGLVNGKL